MSRLDLCKAGASRIQSKFTCFVKETPNLCKVGASRIQSKFTCFGEATPNLCKDSTFFWLFLYIK